MPQTAINQEFKETAIKLALAGDKPISQVATELGIPVKNLYNWLSVWKKKHGDNITVKSSATKSSSDEELRKLQKRNRELELEVEILKKAAAYFAKTLL
jgi:transposase-like protein